MAEQSATEIKTAGLPTGELLASCAKLSTGIVIPVKRTFLIHWPDIGRSQTGRWEPAHSSEAWQVFKNYHRVFIQVTFFQFPEAAAVFTSFRGWGWFFFLRCFYLFFFPWTLSSTGFISLHSS